MKTPAHSKQTTARKTGGRTEEKEGREPTERRASSSPGSPDLIAVAFAPPVKAEGLARRFPVVVDAALLEAVDLIGEAADYLQDAGLQGRSRTFLVAYGLRLMVLELLRRVRLRCPVPPPEYVKGRADFEAGRSLPAVAVGLLRLGFEDAAHEAKFGELVRLAGEVERP